MFFVCADQAHMPGNVIDAHVTMRMRFTAGGEKEEGGNCRWPKFIKSTLLKNVFERSCDSQTDNSHSS